MHINRLFMRKDKYYDEDFVPLERITTTCAKEFQRMAWEKGIKWSEALERGIQEIAFERDNRIERGISIEEPTQKNQIEQLKSQIFQLQKANKVLQEALLNVQKD